MLDDSTLEQNGIRDNSTVSEVVAPTFSWETMTCDVDAVTLDEIKIPYLLNPGCMHVMEEDSLFAMICSASGSGKPIVVHCPLCRSIINPTHFKQVLIRKMRRNF